jgi:hypothetical protein
MISALQLHTLLLNGVVEVLFTKADGTDRRMLATLNDGYLPEESRGKGQLLGETSAAHMSVWDTEANSWRAFRLETIKSVKIKGIEYSPSRSMLTG